MVIIITILLFFVFVALIPVIVISTIIIAKDKEREPVKTLVKYYALGLLSVVIANVFYTIFRFEPNPDTNFLFLFLSVFFGVSVIEEFSKWISVKIGMINDLEFDNMYDGLLFAVIVSLGFAGVENILYVLNSVAEGLASFYLVAAFRAFLAVPGHAIYGLIMGLFLEKAKICKIKNDEFGNIMFHGLSLFVPMILHTIYDSILIYASGNHPDEIKVTLIIIFIVYVIITYIIAIILLIQSSRKSGMTLKGNSNNNVQVNMPVNMPNNYQPNYQTNYQPNYQPNMPNNIPSNVYCPRCGTRIDGTNYCYQCGYRQL